MDTTREYQEMDGEIERDISKYTKKEIEVEYDESSNKKLKEERSDTFTSYVRNDYNGAARGKESSQNK